MKKVIISALLVIVALGLIGCNNTKNSPSEDVTATNLDDTHKVFSFDSAVKLVITGVDGKESVIDSIEVLNALSKVFSYITFETYELIENTEFANSEGIGLAWYDNKGDLLDSFVLIDGRAILYNGWVWKVDRNSPNVDMDVLNNLSVDKETTKDLIPMVMVDRQIYMNTGMVSTRERTKVQPDASITSSVNVDKIPTENNQSNFGTGYGYQWTDTTGVIDVEIGGEWYIFVTEEGRINLEEN